MITREQIKAYCETHPELVSVKQTLNPDLRVLKYKNKVFYKNLWTTELLEMRGTIIDKDWNIVSRPFTKIFNYTEQKAPKFEDDEIVIATRKVNGFMACVTIHKGELLVSTTGTIDSEFAKLAYDWIVPRYGSLIMDYSEGYSWLFEIVDPNDTHIIAEQAGVYLLNIRLKTWWTTQRHFTEKELDEIAHDCGFKRPSWIEGITWENIKKQASSVNHEGFVVYSSIYQEKEVKIKSPYYLATKFIGRMSDRKVGMMYEKPDVFIRVIDEEFYSIVKYIRSTFTMEGWLNMDKKMRILLVREYFDNVILEAV